MTGMTDAPVVAAGSAPGELDATTRALLRRHPHHRRMSQPDYWPLMRAVMGDLAEAEVKRAYLPRGQTEKDWVYDLKVALAHFEGVVEGIVDRFTGAVFEREPEVVYGPEKDAAATELQQWADDVDGEGRTLFEWLEAQFEDVAATGAVGVLVDRPVPDAAKVAAFAAARGGRTTPTTVEEEKLLGIRRPKLVPYRAEEIVDWETDDAGRPLWVKLCVLVSEAADGLAARNLAYEVVLLDRSSVRRWRIPIKADRLKDATPLPLVPPEDGGGLEPAQEIGLTAAHRVGRVPFVFFGRTKRPFCAQPPLLAAARADLGAFQEDAQLRVARMIHSIPTLVLKTDREIGEIRKALDVAIHLKGKSEEAAEYIATPSEAFSEGRTSVESRTFAAFRLAGADPTGLFEAGGASPESGRAKQVRFSGTERRRLAAFAGAVADAHDDLLEVVARRLAPGSAEPPLEGRVFRGSVRYPQEFDLADVGELIDHFQTSRPWIASPTWQRAMARRIALLLRGETSKEERAQIVEEIEKAPPPSAAAPAANAAQDPARDPAGNLVG